MHIITGQTILELMSKIKFNPTYTGMQFMCFALLRLHLTSAHDKASGMDGIIQLGDEEDRLSDDTLRGELFDRCCYIT